jgi:hypothetical protein
MRRIELQNFRDDMKSLERFFNEEGQEKTINIVDPNQDLAWFGYSIGKLLNWIKFEIEKEHEKEREALPND